MALPNVSPIVKVYYGKPVLPEVSRVLACLYEKDFELVAFQDVDCMPVDLIRLQASTSVPTPFFEDGPKFLFESRAICRYISETYANRGNRHLLGRDLLDRVSIEQWLKSEEQSFDPPSRALVLHLAFPTSSNKSYNDLLEESKRLSKVLDVYNHRLGESQYLAGDEFTLADLTHLPNSRYIATSDDWRHLFDERENVKRWWDEVSARPSWIKVEDEIERSKEEEDEEEMTEDNFIEITRYANPKMSLKAGIFQPVETILPVKPKSTITISKNVAGPSGSVQVTVPDKRGYSVSVPEQNVTHVETTRIQPHTKQPVADAKVRMEESTIPTAQIDKPSTEETRVISHSTKPVTDAKVTIEGSDVIPTGAQMPSTARIDKTRTEQTRALPQSTKPVTDAKVTVEKTSSPPASREEPSTHETSPESAKVTEQYAAYPTDETSTCKSHGFLFRQAPTSTSKTEQPTKLSLEGTKAPPTEKTTEKPLTRDQGQKLPPPTATEVTPTHETTTESAKVPEKYTASQADETRSDSRGLRFTQLPAPTSKPVEPIKQSLESPQSSPTEKATTKPRTKDQGQTMTVESKHGQAAEETTNKEKYSASQADETRSDSGNLPFTPVPTSKTVQPTKQSLEGPQSLPTEETTTKSPTKDEGQTLTTESKHGQAAEEPTNKEDEINAEAYLSAKHKEWEEQWQKPEKFGEEKHAKGIPAQKPQPPKFENTTPSATQSPPTTTSSETSTQARQEPLPYKSTNTPAKEPSESRTTTKPKDTTPPATQANTIPAATQDTVIGKTTGVSSASSASNRGSVLQSTSETRNEITDKTSKAPAPKPPKQEGSTTSTPARIATSQTAKQEEPMTNKSTRARAKEPSRSTVPITQEEPSPGTNTTKPRDLTPEVMTQQTTIPAATQAPPPSSANETKDVIANKTKNVPAQSPTTAPLKPMIDKPNNASAIETSKPTVPAAQQETSRGTTTKEREGEIPLGTETPFLASTQNSSNETTGKDQALPATKQAPPASETTIETTGKDQAHPYTKQTQPTDETEAGYADISQSKTASSNANSGIDLEKSSQIDTQMRESEEKQAFPSGTTFKPRTLFHNNQKTSNLFQDENSPSLKETAPASHRSTTEPDTAPKQKEALSETKTEPNKLDTNKPNKTTSQPNKTSDNEDQRPVDETIMEKTKDEASFIQTPPRDMFNKGVPSAQTTSSEIGAKQPASLEEATKDQASKRGELSQDEKSFSSKTPFSNNQNGDELSQVEKPSSVIETAPTSDGRSKAPDTTPKQKEPQNETKMETNSEPNKLDTNKPNKTTSQPNKTSDNEDQRPVDETIMEKTKDEASSIQTPPRDMFNKGVPSAQTTSSEIGAKQPASLEEATKDQASKRGELSQDEKSFSSKTPFSNNQNGDELSQVEKPSSVIETAPTSDGRSKAPDTTPKQKEPQNETKMETNSEPNKLDTNKPNKTTSQPNKTSDNEDQRPVDETIMEKTKDEASSVQTPPRDMFNKGVPSAQTTSSEIGAKQPASLEEATKDQASKRGELSQDEKSFSSKAPFSNNQNGDELSQDEKSSAVIETAPTSDGRSKAPDTTLKQKEPQNETKMENKTGPNQLGTNKPNQITSLPNNTNNVNPMNESLSETNQNKASNESSPEPQIEQNNKPDSTNNPGPANKE